MSYPNNPNYQDNQSNPNNQYNDIVTATLMTDNSEGNTLPIAQTNILSDENVTGYNDNNNNNGNNGNNGKNVFDCVKFTFLFFTMYLFYTIRSVFPVWGQLHAISILQDWNNYCENEGSDLAYYELICASYGIYGVYLLLHFVFTKMWSKSLNAFVQLTDEQINVLGSNNSFALFIFNKYEYFGNFDMYDKKFNLCKKFFGLSGLTICSLGLLTIPIILIDMFHFGNKFIQQKNSMYKYFLGHFYLIISTFGFHILVFTLSKFDSEDQLDRIIARNFFGLGTVPYMIYCYFWYAINWRFNYENNKDTVINNKNLSNGEAKIQIKKLYYLYLLGFVMLVLATGGLYIIFFILYHIQKNMEFTECEKVMLYTSLGLYLIPKLVFEFYKLIYKNRKYYENIKSENKTVLQDIFQIINEIVIFIFTFGFDYMWSTLSDLLYIPGSHRYNRGIYKSLVFAPFFLQYNLNIFVRLISKLILLGYNFILAYFVTMAISDYYNSQSKTYASIILFSLFSYPMCWIIMTILTNEYVIQKYKSMNNYFTMLYLSLRYSVYKTKENVRNYFINIRNYVKINIAETKSNFSKFKTDTYNSFHGYHEGHRKRKNPTTYNHGTLGVPRQIKTYEEYNSERIKNINKNNAKYNMAFVFNSVIGKINFIYNQRTKVHTEYYEKLWNDRYDKFIELNTVGNEVMLTNEQLNKLKELIKDYEYDLDQKFIEFEIRKDELYLKLSILISNSYQELMRRLRVLSVVKINDKEKTFDNFFKEIQNNQLRTNDHWKRVIAIYRKANQQLNQQLNDQLNQMP